jgi:peptidylprolyl isomerase
VNTTMKRRAVVLAVAAALALTGCASDDDATPSASTTTETPADAPTTEAPAEPTAEDLAALESVKLEGPDGAELAAGTEPTVVFEPEVTVTAPVAKVFSEGDGDVVEDGQKLSIQLVRTSGADASVLSTTYGATPEEIVLGDTTVFKALTEALSGATIGSRIVFLSPVEGAEGAATTEVMALEITGARSVPTRAQGTAVEPEAGLPTVTLDDTGKPSIKIPEGYEAATELVVQPLIEGDGPEVTADQSVTAHYTGMLLDGTVFDSSWDRGTPADFPLSGVIPGWTEGLTGQKVGSQVLLVIPADKGYGDQASESIPANSTLVFVVDILDAY